MEMRVALADAGNDGGAWLCSRCEDVHVRWENWTVTMTRPQFEKLVRMTETAGRKLGQLRAVPPSLQDAVIEKAWLQ
jgi:hypothetical protein